MSMEGPLVSTPAWQASEPQIQLSNQSFLNARQAPSTEPHTFSPKGKISAAGKLNPPPCFPQSQVSLQPARAARPHSSHRLLIFQKG